MIGVRVLKTVAKAFVVAVLVSAGAGVLFGLTSVVVLIGSGADPTDAFQPVTSDPTADLEQISWTGDSTGLVRSVEPSTRRRVAVAWVSALAASEDAARSGDTGPMDIWFSGGAALRAEAALVGEPGPRPSWSAHRMHISFYSLDGQVIGLGVFSEGTVQTGVGPRTIDSSYQLVLVLLDGNWRLERVTRL